MNTEILLDHETTADGDRVVRMLLRLHGEARGGDDRSPLHLALVLDRSGSMAGAKLAAAREAAALLVQRLRPEDVIGVVAYDDQVTTVALPETGAAQQDLTARIARIGPGGSTNLSGGWLRGRELLAGTDGTPRIRRVILLTDGLANVGITDPPRLIGLCETARGQGITTSTVGFGAGYDEALLRAMADAGGGETYYIEHADQAQAIFAHELEGLLSVCAQNVTVSLHPAPDARLIVIHHAYPQTGAGAATRLELGDLYAREPKALLAEFLMPGSDDEAKLAEVVVTADVLLPDGAIEHREVRLDVRVTPAGEPVINPEVRRELLLQRAAHARRRALDDRNRGDYGAACARLRELALDLTVAGQEDAVLAEEAQDLAAMADRFMVRDVSVMDEKYMYQRAHDAGRGRAVKSELISRMRRGYGTPPKP